MPKKQDTPSFDIEAVFLNIANGCRAVGSRSATDIGGASQQVRWMKADGIREGRMPNSCRGNGGCCAT